MSFSNFLTLEMISPSINSESMDPLSQIGLDNSPLFKFVVYSYCYEYTMVCEWLNGQKLSKNAKRIE